MTDVTNPLSLFDLTGKVAVVTGGSRGLGKAMVEAFARQGADVVIASRKLPACEELAAAVTAETGRRAVPVACHVGDWAQCDALYERVYAEFGRCDILVNNAGMSPLYNSLVEVTEALFDKVIEVNLRGPFRLMSLFGDRMKRERRRVDHQRQLDRGGEAHRGRGDLRGGQGRPQQHDRSPSPGPTGRRCGSTASCRGRS